MVWKSDGKDQGQGLDERLTERFGSTLATAEAEVITSAP